MVSKIVKRKRTKSFKKFIHLTIKPPIGKKSFIIKKSLDNDRRTLPPLPSPNMKTVFLDLDDTLTHTTVSMLNQPPPEKFDFSFTTPDDDHRFVYYVRKRPFVDEFLNFLSERFEIVVFTAGIQSYASAILDRLDPTMNLISHRLYRDSCTIINGKCVKDLSKTGRYMSRVVIVDDSPDSYLFQPGNAMPIQKFTNDDEDEELSFLMPFFHVLASAQDARVALKEYRTEVYGDDMDNM
ncbi:hypothetical protein ACJIZ3_023123 [Penstemon smallii]|uniref:FCP1 homology domain-containing protein n=1 Tax=Penstemon smallii TaxID=265156 RepID=A0ABD3TN72_9LAMI